MTIQDFFHLRHELMLLGIALLVLILELGTKPANKTRLVPVIIALFGIHTFVGFLPLPQGTLFGGMFVVSPLLTTMKNILNVGVFIILFQSYHWIVKPDNQDKLTEYFILLFTTLIGMYFMISSGDFLMFYLGLETASIPLAALAAYT